MGAGQYISVAVPVASGKELRRPYSIASAPENNLPKNPMIDFCIQKIEGGPGSTYLDEMKVGDTFKGYAPFGFLFYHPKPGRKVIFVSTGTGIAPFRSILFSEEFKKSPPGQTLFLFGARREEDILYQEEISSIENIQWQLCLSKPENKTDTFFHGRVTEYLFENQNRIDWADTDFYLCGNGDMVREVKKLCVSKGVARDSIHLEVYFTPVKQISHDPSMVLPTSPESDLPKTNL
jgi:ferredoxin-NADP reductase